MTNVVLILGDDMRYDLMPYMPFLNGTLRLAGTELTEMRCEVPLCSPARAAIITGRHARDPENQVYTQAEGITNPSTHALPVWLQPVTASNAMFGKYMVNGSSALQPGWDRWCVINTNTQEAYTYTCKDETGAVYGPGTATNTHQLKYLQSMVNTHLSTVAEPFFTYLAPTNPHINGTTFENNPWPETCSKFAWFNWPMSHLLSDANMATKPSFRQRAQYTQAELDFLGLQIRQQVRECSDMDTVIKSMWDTLVARGGGVNSRTIWIFATDSGVFYEEQRWQSGAALIVPSGKNDIFDCVSRVPSIIAGPGIQAGAKNNTPMTLQDITATIVNIFGATPSVTLRGTDIRTFLASPPADRDTLFEHAQEPPSPDDVGIVTKTRKLIRYAAQAPLDTYEMYDLDTDPWENINVANDAARLTERNALEARLNAIP